MAAARRFVADGAKKRPMAIIGQAKSIEDHSSSGAAGLLESGWLADATIRLGTTHTWKIHKLIVCSQSDYLKTALMGHFQEASTGEINLDFNYWSQYQIDCLVKFLYTGAIDFRELFPQFWENPFYVLMRIWEVADYFRVGKLLAAVETERDNHMVLLAKQLCQREMIGHGVVVKFGGPFVLDNPCQQLQTAIDELYNSATGKYHDFSPVQAAFQPSILRCFLCLPRDTLPRIRLPRNLLDNDAANGPWKEYKAIIQALTQGAYLDATFVAARERAYSRRKCTICQRKWEKGDPNYECPISGLVYEEVVEICDACFRVPTLQAWKDVETYKVVEQRSSALCNGLKSQRAAILGDFGLALP